MNSLERLVALNNKSKRNDNFTVNFLRLPENMSNILGRQVRSIDRPSINFDPIEKHNRGGKFIDQGKVEFQPVNIEFWDDENAITNTLLYVQIFRQMNQWKDINNILPEQRTDPEDREYRFDIKVQFYNSLEEKTESFIMHDCLISEISHPTMDITDETEVRINVSISFNNLSIDMLGEYQKMIQSIPK